MIRNQNISLHTSPCPASAFAVHLQNPLSNSHTPQPASSHLPHYPADIHLNQSTHTRPSYPALRQSPVLLFLPLLSLLFSLLFQLQEKQRKFRCFSCIRIIHFSYIFPYIQNLECMILHSQLQADILQFQVVCLQSSFDQMNICRTLSIIQQTRISQ